MMKKIVLCVLLLFAFVVPVFAVEYEYFYGNTCAHCHKVEAFLDKENIEDLVKITHYEVFANQENRNLLKTRVERLNLSMSQI